MFRLLIFSICLSFIGCLPKEECFANEIDTQSIDNVYGCEGTHNKLKIKDGKNFYLIKNQEDFLAAVEAECSFEIDFDKYDLVIGKKFQFIPHRIELYKTCDNNFIFQVSDNKESSPEKRFYVYHALVVKGILTSKSNIIISFTYNTG